MIVGEYLTPKRNFDYHNGFASRQSPPNSTDICATLRRNHFRLPSHVCGQRSINRHFISKERSYGILTTGSLLKLEFRGEF